MWNTTSIAYERVLKKHETVYGVCKCEKYIERNIYSQNLKELQKKNIYI